eukprot:SAG31_NODE_352_length_17229_cov_9.658669_4_plen_315_part_00
MSRPDAYKAAYAVKESPQFKSWQSEQVPPWPDIEELLCATAAPRNAATAVAVDHMAHKLKQMESTWAELSALGATFDELRPLQAEIEYARHRLAALHAGTGTAGPAAVSALISLLKPYCAATYLLEFFEYRSYGIIPSEWHDMWHDAQLTARKLQARKLQASVCMVEMAVPQAVPLLHAACKLAGNRKERARNMLHSAVALVLQMSARAQLCPENLFVDVVGCEEEEEIANAAVERKMAAVEETKRAEQLAEKARRNASRAAQRAEHKGYNRRQRRHKPAPQSGSHRRKDGPGLSRQSKNHTHRHQRSRCARGR